MKGLNLSREELTFILMQIEDEFSENGLYRLCRSLNDVSPAFDFEFYSISDMWRYINKIKAWDAFQMAVRSDLDFELQKFFELAVDLDERPYFVGYTPMEFENLVWSKFNQILSLLNDPEIDHRNIDPLFWDSLGIEKKSDQIELQRHSF